MEHSGRREFLKQMAAFSGGMLLAHAATAVDWKKQAGIELFTVRDQVDKDLEATIAQLAKIGFKEVEPAHAGANAHVDFSPKHFRTLVDRYGMSVPSTHIAVIDGPDFEKQLEGLQSMGVHYAPLQTQVGGKPFGTGGEFMRAPLPTEEEVKRMAGEFNRLGGIGQKFGIKALIHNHTGEFEPFSGKKTTAYDVFLAETDPARVVMQIDCGWAAVAGQNLVEMFHKHPGRFELWHVKDAVGMKLMDPKLHQLERFAGSTLVPVGTGEVDYKPLFANAAIAGLKHYCVEQDNAADWGDSMAAARTSYEKLTHLLA